MAKTPLNENVDAFFKKYSGENITESNVKSNIKINGTNDYGNILHAIINYKYNEEDVLKTINILLSLGVDPNYRGKATGMTFIHLAFYGYTDAQGNDHSYSEEFIIKLIKMAIPYGFDVNIKDKDDETIVVASIASEVYNGSISSIISAIGCSYTIDESLKEDFDAYLNESKSNPAWHKRLASEQDKLYRIVDSANMSIEDIEKDIKDNTSDLVKYTTNLDYNALKGTYKDISAIIKTLISLLKKREIFEVKDDTTSKNINIVISSINNVLTNELNEIKENPNEKRISEIKTILEEFLLSELLDILKEVENNYHDYQESLRTSARSVRTINEGKNFIQDIKGNELESEITDIVESIINELLELISSLKESLENDAKVFASIQMFTDEVYEEKTPDYDNLTKEEITALTTKITKRTSNYRNYVLNFLHARFGEIVNQISPLIESEFITPEDIKECLGKCLNEKKQGIKKDYGKVRK